MPEIDAFLEIHLNSYSRRPHPVAGRPISKDRRQARALPYAEPRAYEDRLNKRLNAERQEALEEDAIDVAA